MGFGKFVSGITDSIGLTDSGAGGRSFEAQRRAMEEANRIQKEMYDEAKQRYKPWQEGGTQGFNSMIDLANNYQNFSEADGPFKGHSGRFTMADFKTDPGYEFRMKEGQKALERSAAARGSGMSGGAMKALANYGQNLASSEYQNAYNRFNNDYSNAYNRHNNDFRNKFNNFNQIANYGQNANSALTSVGNNYANNVSQNAISLGNAEANYEMNKNNHLRGLWDMGAQAFGAAYGAGMMTPTQSRPTQGPQPLAMNYGASTGGSFA